MNTRQIGSLTVSTVGLGCNNFGRRLDYAATERVVHAALDAGVTFFDTADVYVGSEEFLGRALGARRHDVIVATKFGLPFDRHAGGAKPAYIRQSLDESLQHLRSERIDLYQLHRPDPDTPIADTLSTLGELVAAGKIREIGCSNFSAAQLREARAAAAAAGCPHFVSVQNEYSLLLRDPEGEVLAECARLGMAFIPYFPLASGLLTGRYLRGAPPPPGTRLANESLAARFLSEARLDTVEALQHFAEAHGHSVLELAMSWLLHHPVVASVIAGATEPAQVMMNINAAHAWRLTAAELAEIDRLAPLVPGQ